MSATTTDTPRTQDESGNAPKDKGKRNRALLIAALVFGLAALAWFLLWLFVFSKRETTDDAYVGGNQVGISAQVPGIVIGVYADDTQRVNAGQLLVKLDPTDGDVALRKASSALAQAVRQVRQQTQSAASADAALGTRRQDLKRAQDDLKRRIPLLAEKAVAPEEVQHARRRRHRAVRARIGAAPGRCLARPGRRQRRGIESRRGAGTSRLPPGLDRRAA